MRHLLLALSVGLMVPAVARAQGTVDCTEGNLPHNSNEAKIFKTYAVPLAFTAGRAPLPLRPGSVTVVLEGAYVPQLDSAERIPSYCRPGKGPENTNLITIFPRPRVILAGAQGFFLELSWVPPIRVNGTKANLFGIGLGRAAVGKTTTVQLRGYFQFGTINGPVTCPESAVTDPTNSFCYGLPVSDDSYKPNQFGIEGSVGFLLGNRHLVPYVGFGVNFERPRFQVSSPPNQKVEANMTRTAVMGGLQWTLSNLLAFTGEVYADPAQAVTGRLLASFSFGGYSGKRRR